MDNLPQLLANLGASIFACGCSQTLMTDYLRVVEYFGYSNAANELRAAIHYAKDGGFHCRASDIHSIWRNYR